MNGATIHSLALVYLTMVPIDGLKAPPSLPKGCEAATDDKKAQSMPDAPSTTAVGDVCIVSHVPSAVSVAGTSTATDSSCDTVNLHPFDPLTRKSDEETFEGSHPKTAPLTVSNESQPPNESPRDSPVPSSAASTDSSKMPIKKRHRDGASLGPAKKRKISEDEPASIAPAPSKLLLLAQPTDDQVLSPLHAFVRKQIEVFCATETEVSQPAPGRKHPIQLQQVGLRCIHCSSVPIRKRVKRAV